MLQSTKVEQALRRILASHPCLVCSGDDSERLAYDLCNHTQAVFAIVRYLMMEDTGKSWSQRRHGKTGGLRKAMKAHHWRELQPVLSDMSGCGDAEQV